MGRYAVVVEAVSLAGLMVRDVTILTPDTDTGRYGDAEKDWTEATSTSEKGWLAQQSAVEVLGDREAQVTEWVLFLWPDSSVVAGARVVIDGDTFDVDGLPNHAWTPRGEHHIEARLRWVEG